jgi:type IV secretion system protein VirD4
MGVIGFGLLAWRFQGRKPNTHGSAHWASVWSVFREGLFEKKGIRVGDWTGQLSVHYDGVHAITFGQPGSGKGTSAILPNLLSYPWFFLIDPGGENTAIAAKSWAARRIPFACINVFGMHGEQPWALPAHGFNPLDALDSKSPTFAADALVLAEMLTPRAGNESSNHAYFKEAAQTAKRAMLIHIKTAEPRERQNLATLYEGVYCDAGGWNRLLEAMKANPACGGLVIFEAFKLERIEQQGPEEFSAIMSTIQQDLSFLADPLVREKLSRSDADFSILKGRKHGQRGGIISVVLPLEYMETHAAIGRLALACAVLEMQRKPLAKNKVVFLIDEAAALGRILALPNWLATLRKYRVAFWTIWQSIGQVADLYGKGWQTIIGNCGLLQFLGVGDLETAEHTEKLLGQATVATVSKNARGERSVAQTGRPLLTKDELRRLKEQYQIVFIGNLPPMLLRKTPYWERGELAGRFHPNPYRDGPTRGRASGDLWGQLYYMLVCLMAPHPLAAWFILTAAGALAMRAFGPAG